MVRVCQVDSRAADSLSRLLNLQQGLIFGLDGGFVVILQVWETVGVLTEM